MSSLLGHEMDAIDKKEWRYLYVLRELSHSGALRWFILLHLPLFVGLMALVAAGPSTATRRIEGGVDALLVAHAAVHESVSRRGDEAFANSFSRLLIWSAALFGAAHLSYRLLA